jgi:hypothetical protein
MYLPVLRGKRFELAALRELSDSLADWGVVVPIIEPVKRGGLSLALNELVDNGVCFALIVNPKVGEFTERTRTIETEFVEEYLDEYDNYYPALYVDSGSTSRQVSDFSARYDIPVLFFISGTPHPQTLQSIIDAEPPIVALRDRRVPIDVAERLSGEGVALAKITDPFNRQIRNADYLDREFFSDAHLQVDDTFQHFGDYSIVGDAYTEGGGAAFTVALHHVIAALPESQRLDVLHYKSDPSDTTADVGGKFLQALGRLVEGQEGCDEINETQALEKYRELLQEEHFPGLGFAKKLGLMQHFEVIANILGQD